jgi:hypothetical protein
MVRSTAVPCKIPSVADNFAYRLKRVFHQTKYSNIEITQQVRLAMVNEQAKMMSQTVPTFDYDHQLCLASAAPPPSPPPSPTAQYSPTGGSNEFQDRCHIHVWQHENCNPDNSNFQASIQMWDAAGKEILAITGLQDINDNEHGGSWASKLESRITLTGEHQGDYIQFSVADQAWPSNQSDKSKDNWCNTGGWDPKQGPSCGSAFDSSVPDAVCYDKQFLSSLTYS